jgi:DUF3102 family protein
LRDAPARGLQALARKIKAQHRAARDAAERAALHARAAGQLLIDAKTQLSHGDWLPWLRDHCDLSARTAQTYMLLARLTKQEAQRVAHLPLRQALRSLATPRTSSEIGSAVFANDRILDAAFAHFRQTGFPYRRVPVHVAMQRLNQLASTDSRALLSSTIGYDVADSYHPHRLRATGGEGKLSPVEAFERDKSLRRALHQELEQGHQIPAGYFGGLLIVSATQPCSNFRPGVALHYYRRYCKAGATVLDTSSGYGGRLVGFLASGVAGRYIGIDPNRQTHEGNRRLAADLGFAKAVELHCLPAEDVRVEVMRGRCDFALTSPPYFTKEHYSDEPTQSWKRYPTPESWREGFLRPMLRLQFAALKRGAVSVVNVDDVTIKNTVHAVAEWTKALASDVGFELIAVEEMKFPITYRSTDTSEPIFIFKKQ